ncbi:MAG: hypothetical protein AAF683_01425 [Pseudomonadota bacterium]
MKDFPIDLAGLGLVLAAGSGFAGSTWAFKTSVDTGDHRWLVGAIALLVVSYIPFLTLLGQSMSATIVATSMMGQIIALVIAFAVYGEALTLIRVLGLVAAVIAIVAFALPATPKS